MPRSSVSIPPECGRDFRGGDEPGCDDRSLSDPAASNMLSLKLPWVRGRSSCFSSSPCEDMRGVMRAWWSDVPSDRPAIEARFLPQPVDHPLPPSPSLLLLLLPLLLLLLLLLHCSEYCWSQLVIDPSPLYFSPDPTLPSRLDRSSLSPPMDCTVFCAAVRSTPAPKLPLPRGSGDGNPCAFASSARFRCASR